MKKVRINENVIEIQSNPVISTNDTLIPTDLVDEAFQRIFVASLFVLLQAWKIYDLITLGTSIDKFTFIVKYALIDGFFLWLLPVLNIPYLIFTPIRTLLLTILFNVINIVLVNNINWMLLFTVPYFQLPQKELTVGEISQGGINIDDHFKGRYTIHYLPDSLAKFNVFNLQGCQDDAVPFYIPIEFNTTTDVSFVEIEYTSPHNTVVYQQYSKTDITKLLKRDISHLKQNKQFLYDESIFYLEVPASKPGQYKISKIKDLFGSSMRFVQNPFTFAECPKAEFTIPKLVTKKLCVGRKLDDFAVTLPLLTLQGTVPLKSEILATFNGKAIKVITTEVSAPAELPYNVTQVYSHVLTRNLLEQELLKDPSILDVSESGNLQFQLLQVSDGLGNVKKYNPQADSLDVRYNLELLTKPLVRLIDMDPTSLLLVNGTKGLSFAALRNIIEQLPLLARFNFEDPKDLLLSYNFTYTFNTLNDLKNGMQVTKQGTYRLLSVLGNHCACDVQESVVKIDIAKPPTLDIQGYPVTDKCVGTTGYKFEFIAQGQPPFVVEYAVYGNTSNHLRPLVSSQGRIDRIIKSDDNNFNFDYKPPGEGNYVIKFKTIRDHYYQSPVFIDETTHTYLIYFKQKSRVTFFEQPGSLHKVIRTCLGQSTTIPIYFKGHFPFTFDYSIVDSSNKIILSQKNVNVDKEVYEINTNSITVGGHYRVVISKILDGNSCAVDYNEAEAVEIITRSDIPEIGFDTKSQVTNYKVLEGDIVEVPLIMKSTIKPTSNDKLEYEYIDSDNRKTIKTASYQGNLKLKQPGTYKLLGVNNGGCDGKVFNNKTIAIEYYDRPQLSIEAPAHDIEQTTNHNLILNAGCQNCQKTVQLNLQGRPPFILDYEIKFPSGRTESRKMTIENTHLAIDLPTAQSGLYEHRFKGIYDDLYDKSRHYKGPTMTVSYNIHEKPLIEFAESATIQLCEAMLHGPITDLTNVPILLYGKGPFSLNLTLLGETIEKSFHLRNINTEVINLNSVLANDIRELRQGEYTISIDGIQDINQCMNREIKHTQLVISVTAAPDIQPLTPDKSDYCVGQHIGYNLSGTSPFILYYNFNNKTYESKIQSRFTRLASHPGTIRVIAIEDSSSGRCMIDIAEGSIKSKSLEINIHDLPSVEINQGDSIIQNIHQGDLTEMKFKFSGTPPFSVTYIRTLNRGTLITETNTITDIWDYEYSVNVGLEGTYEAIEVTDAFCIAKRDISP